MSVMVRYIAFFAFLAVFCGCSDDSGTSALVVDDGTGTAIGSSGSTSSGGDPVKVVTKETIEKDAENLYYSEGIFCWTDGCEKDFSSTSGFVFSSTSKPKSSSSAAVKQSSSSKAVSSSSVAMATDDGKTMKDPRNNKSYAIETIGTTVWMAENLFYSASSGMYCTATGKTANQCEEYGSYYTYATAKNICPGGWRLPTIAEFEAAIKVKDLTDNLDWWTMGGRFKKTGTTVEFGQAGDIGYIWLQQTSDGKMSVQYQKDRYEALSQEDRGYNVRCVKN